MFLNYSLLWCFWTQGEKNRITSFFIKFGNPSFLEWKEGFFVSSHQPSPHEQQRTGGAKESEKMDIVGLPPAEAGGL